MKKIFPGLSLLILLSACQSQPARYLAADAPLFQTQDLTAENLFSQNIEGPSVHHDSLFVVNYRHDGTIAYVSPKGDVSLYVNLPEGSTANSIKFDEAGNMYLADFAGHNILKVDPARKVSVFCHNDAFNQPNDICRSTKGWLLASDPNWKDSTGQIWRIDTNGAATLLTKDMGTANGIELSPDEKRLYVNVSVQREIWTFDIDPEGNISNKQLFATFSDFGLDGMHCDAEGNLYVCRWGKGVIAIFNPAGKLIREVPLKGKKCSNLVFGDIDGKTVFVTLQDRKGMEMFRTDIAGKDFR
jgi:sugar lactone lactonase YvrE